MQRLDGPEPSPAAEASAGPQAVAVVGLGGIGGVAAGCLAEAGIHRIVGCARRPLERLTLERDETALDLPLRTLTDPGEAEPVDWVLLATKAQDTAAAGPWLERLCGPSTRVAVLQNGVDHSGRVAPFIGEARAVPVIVYYNGERIAPDRVRLRHIGGDDMIVADEPDGRAFAALFAGTSLAVGLSADLLTLMWRKLLINAVANPIGALTRQRQVVMRRGDIRALGLAVLEEAAAVAAACGARLEPDEPERTLARLLTFPEEAGTSMYFDTLAGRPLEFEALTGAVVAAGERHGIATPLNRALLALLSAISDAARAAA